MSPFRRSNGCHSSGSENSRNTRSARSGVVFRSASMSNAVWSRSKRGSPTTDSFASRWAAKSSRSRVAASSSSWQRVSKKYRSRTSGAESMVFSQTRSFFSGVVQRHAVACPSPAIPILRQRGDPAIAVADSRFSLERTTTFVAATMLRLLSRVSVDGGSPGASGAYSLAGVMVRVT